MKKLHLLTTVAAALLLTAGAAAAQGMKDQAPERAPAAQQSAPAEKMAPPMRAGERKATTGRANERTKSGKDSQAESKSGKKSETTGQATKSAQPGKVEMNSQSSEKAGASSGANIKADENTKMNASPNASQSSTRSNATVGQGAAAGAANLSSTQRTKITTIIRQHKVQPTHLDISVRVGARIPESVHFYPLPVEVVDVYPAWRGYDYILVGDEIIVVDPHNHTIVAVLEA